MADCEVPTSPTESESSPSLQSDETPKSSTYPTLDDNTAMYEALGLTITEALKDKRSLVDIQDILEKDSMSAEELGVCFPPNLQWELVFAAMEENRDDVLHMLLEKGVSPNLVCPEGKQYAGATALQVAADLENLELVKVLICHKADVNVGTALYTNDIAYSEIFRMFPPECRNALSIAFAKDNPALMKLLISGYVRSYIPNGKSFLCLAFRARATKCVTSLLMDPELKTCVDPFEVPLKFGYLPGINVISVLYEVGYRQGVYSPDDLGLCLSEVTQNTQWKPCFCPNRPLRNCLRSDLVEIITVLIDLGADVNFESLSKEKSPLEGLLSIQYIENDSSLVRHSASTLLNHGAKTRFHYVNKFFLDILAIILHGSCYDSADVSEYFLSMMSLLYSKKYLNLIKCWNLKVESDACLIMDGIRKMGVIIDVEFSLCQTVREAIRLAVLNANINFINLLQCIPKPCSTLPHNWEAFYTFLLLRMSVLPHNSYQLSANVVHTLKFNASAPEVQSQANLLCYCFPLIRSLKELARVTILESLPLPKSVFADALGLPKLLQRHVCLE